MSLPEGHNLLDLLSYAALRYVLNPSVQQVDNSLQRQHLILSEFANNCTAQFELVT